MNRITVNDEHYRECPICTRNGWAPDNYWPETGDFWPRRHERLHFGACKACRDDIQRKTPSYQRKRFGQICRKHARALRQEREAA